MKITLNLPLPDHNPKAAFEFLTGWGWVRHVDALQGTFTYELEGESPQAIMRLIGEDVNEIRCYDWWESRDIMRIIFEQAQRQIDMLNIGVCQWSLTKAERDDLHKLLNRIDRSHTFTPNNRERDLLVKVRSALETFEPLMIHPAEAVA